MLIVKNPSLSETSNYSPNIIQCNALQRIIIRLVHEFVKNLYVGVLKVMMSLYIENCFLTTGLIILKQKFTTNYKQYFMKLDSKCF